jgi:hypothetical protein
MTDRRISQLTVLTGADAEGVDFLPIVDNSENTTKRISRLQFFRNVPDLRVGTDSPVISDNANGFFYDLGLGRMTIRAENTSPLLLRRWSTDGDVAVFRNTANTTVGSISTTATTTAYNTSSDYRLKKDLQPIADACARLMALKPVNFAWKSDGSRVDGFLAHEAQEVVPEAVTGQKDAVDEDGNPEYQGIDQSKLVPLLVAALQDALRRIEALEG